MLFTIFIDSSTLFLKQKIFSYVNKFTYEQSNFCLYILIAFLSVKYSHRQNIILLISLFEKYVISYNSPVSSKISFTYKIIPLRIQLLKKQWFWIILKKFITYINWLKNSSLVKLPITFCFLQLLNTVLTFP